MFKVIETNYLDEPNFNLVRLNSYKLEFGNEFLEIAEIRRPKSL